MKKYTSVLMLFARSTLYKLLGILVLCGAAETILFRMAMQPDVPLESAFQSSHIPLVCALAFLVLLYILTVPAFQKSGYLLRRMSLQPKELFLCHTLHNTVCLVIFWGFQVCLLTALFHWFGAQADEMTFGPQSILLAYYREPFLHSLLPLADWTRYLRNLFLALGMGAMAACPLAHRGSRGSLISLLVLALIAIRTFSYSMGSRTFDLLLGTAGILVTVTALFTIGGAEELSAAEVPEVPTSTVFDADETEVSQDAAEQ